ncbi:flagellar hook-associated protein FlgL (plasmid) [Citricoccus nitrophenolicus]
MITRVTTAMTSMATRANLQDSARTLADLQNRAATRQAITRPSDDPTGTQTAITTRADLAAATQYERNLQNADIWLSTIDASLQTGVDLVMRVQELALRGSNGTMNEAARTASAEEVDQLRAELLNVANTQVTGRHVFAGTHAGDTAFNQDGTWNGQAGSTVQRRISDTNTIQVDVPGAQAFGAGADSVFATLDRLSAALRSGGDVAASLTELETARSRMVGSLTASGARHATVSRSLESITEKLTSLEATRMVTEEKDLAEAAIELQTQQVYYQAALSVSAQSIQQSLLDYLR